MSKESVTVARRTALGLGFAAAAGLATGAKAEGGKGVKITVLYGAPKSPEEFEKYYAEKHMPMVNAIKEIPKVEISKGLPTPEGKPPAFYRVAELWFDSPEQMQKVLAMPAMKAVGDDLKNFASGGATIVVSQMG